MKRNYKSGIVRLIYGYGDGKLKNKFKKKKAVGRKKGGWAQEGGG